MAKLELVIQCKVCGWTLDRWPVEDVDDPATLVCEIAGDLDFEHECQKTVEPLSPYVLQPAEGTSCPHCHQQPRLLMRDDGEVTKNISAPAFYVCQCGFIGHVGVGPVLGSDPIPIHRVTPPRLRGEPERTPERTYSLAEIRDGTGWAKDVRFAVSK